MRQAAKCAPSWSFRGHPRSGAFGCAGLLALLLALLPAPPGAALPTPLPPNDHNDAGPDLFDVYNRLTGSSYQSNAQLGGLLIADPGLWSSGGPGAAVALSSSADNRNTFGFYPAGAPSQRSALLRNQTGFGFLGPVFDAAFFNPASEVGFYLRTRGESDDLWHSQSELDARGSRAHLAAYALPELVALETDEGSLELHGGWLLGWEDLRDAQSDGDYDDLVLAIGAVLPAPPENTSPEPGTRVLVALGLLGLAGLARRRPARARR